MKNHSWQSSSNDRYSGGNNSKFLNVQSPNQKFSPIKENVISPNEPYNRHAHGANQNRERRHGVHRQASTPEHQHEDNNDGPFNFRQMLRKTDYAPTATLRKMKSGSLDFASP